MQGICQEGADCGAEREEHGVVAHTFAFAGGRDDVGDDGAKRCGGEAVSQALNDAGYDEWDESGENEVRHDADEENRESCQQYFFSPMRSTPSPMNSLPSRAPMMNAPEANPANPVPTPSDPEA